MPLYIHLDVESQTTDSDHQIRDNQVGRLRDKMATSLIAFRRR